MRRIWLRNVRKYAKVSDQDFSWLSKFHWWGHHSGYAVTSVCTQKILMHRLVMLALPGVEVDHRNQDKLDNRRCNLRPASLAQNRRNRGPQKNSTTGYRGVHFHKHNQRWTTKLSRHHGGYIGSFATAREAALAYNRAAKKAYGKFACLNKL